MHDFGVYTRQELRSRDVTDSDLRREVRRGVYTHEHNNWYSIPSADPTALAAVRKHGALSCVTALEHYGVWLPPQVDKVHLRGNSQANRDHPGRYCRHFGRPLPVTTILDDPHTALRHALRCLDLEGITVVCDSLLNMSLRMRSGLLVAEVLTPGEVESAFDGAPEHIVACFNRCDERAASGTETMVRVRLRSLGLKVEVQAYVPGLGHVDLKVGDRLLIEIDSKAHHTGVHNYDEDHRRDQVATSLGLHRLPLTYKNVVYEWPATVDKVLDAVRGGHHLAPRRRKVSTDITAEASELDYPVDCPDP
ncbi:hypothetical protein GIY30_03000 [Gordonia sp. HNM0687]|uniref:DUF559 domain-containing protein n=1 Tax=Gordonia mangrovi TaxID=2665643 RepID=A0A6L7GK87_9ACTN|nr:hypothetical protein [Gordonia mangrovi]MXP20324.1 hypothetical protein [Gordonia mangrovi]UVF79075.1 hypothetical protein NWF22_04250 [Gordonia mangrovi]